MSETTPPAEEPQAETYLWIVVRKDAEEIEIWSDQEKAEAAIESKGADPGSVLLYHVAESELKRAFPNRPIVGGDMELDTKNKYIRKGWNPGQK